MERLSLSFNFGVQSRNDFTVHRGANSLVDTDAVIVEPAEVSVDRDGWCHVLTSLKMPVVIFLASIYWEINQSLHFAVRLCFGCRSSDSLSHMTAER